MVYRELGMFFRLVQGQHGIGLPLGGLEALFSHVPNNSCTTQVNLLSQWPVLETCTAADLTFSVGYLQLKLCTVAKYRNCSCQYSNHINKHQSHSSKQVTKARTTIIGHWFSQRMIERTWSMIYVFQKPLQRLSSDLNLQRSKRVGFGWRHPPQSAPWCTGQTSSQTPSPDCQHPARNTANWPQLQKISLRTSEINC